jgi:hypothetical protein
LPDNVPVPDSRYLVRISEIIGWYSKVLINSGWSDGYAWLL